MSLLCFQELCYQAKSSQRDANTIGMKAHGSEVFMNRSQVGAIILTLVGFIHISPKIHFGSGPLI